MIVIRYPDWPELLNRAAAERRSIPFQWGTNDCVSSASTIIASYTGTDIMKNFRGTYSSALGAVRLFKQHGGFLELVNQVCGEHGVIEVPRRSAGRGDLSAFVFDGRLTLAVLNGFGAWAPSKDGLVNIPLNTIIKSWRIN